MSEITLPPASSTKDNQQSGSQKAADHWNLPVAFYFQVTIQGSDLAFKEVSGLTNEMELEEVAEGGLNEYVHKLPKQIKHGNLILKRAIGRAKDEDVAWIREIIEGDKFEAIQTKDIIVKLLNAEGNVLTSWTCRNAFPVKWEVDSLDSEKNSVLIETLEFSYTRLIRQK